jgi:hypothetical protein
MAASETMHLKYLRLFPMAVDDKAWVGRGIDSRASFETALTDLSRPSARTHSTIRSYYLESSWTVLTIAVRFLLVTSAG